MNETLIFTPEHGLVAPAPEHQMEPDEYEPGCCAWGRLASLLAAPIEPWQRIGWLAGTETRIAVTAFTPKAMAVWSVCIADQWEPLPTPGPAGSVNELPADWPISIAVQAPGYGWSVTVLAEKRHTVDLLGKLDPLKVGLTETIGALNELVTLRGTFEYLGGEGFENLACKRPALVHPPSALVSAGREGRLHASPPSMH